MTDEEKRIDDTELRRSLYTIVTTHKDHAGGLSKNALTDDLVRYFQEWQSEVYLSHFEYVDYEVGGDSYLRVGDFIYCNHQRPHDGYEQSFEGRIVEHHVNQLPVILYNVDPKEPDSSGNYADLQTLMMDGWEFTRIA